MQIQLYDTTLRDGTQREGMSLSAEDKVKIACELDRLGIQYIEGGWPGSNPKDAEFFQRIQLARDLDLILGGERHTLALGAIAQGGVVELNLHLLAPC